MLSEVALHYFYEAATLGSMRLASDRIGVAVSSISRQIAHLEEQLGISLIERGRRSIRLTEAGQLMYQHHKQQMSTRDQLMGRLEQLRDVRAGHVELAVGEGFLTPGFMHLIDTFQRRNPGVTVALRTVSTPDAARMILEDEVHMGILFLLNNEPRIRTRAAVAQPLLAVCSRDHPAAQSPSLDLDELARHKLILPPKSFRIRQILATAEARRHVFLNPCLTTDSIHVMRALAKEGRALTVLPRIAILSDLQDGSLVARPLTIEAEEPSIALVHRIGRQLDGVASRFLSTLESQFRALFDEPGIRLAGAA